MKERSIFTVISFCIFALTLGKLTSAGSQGIKVCREVCTKTNGCVLVQEGIVTFACHRPIDFHGSTGEQSNQSMETDKGMECTQPCTSEFENSIMMEHVNIGKKTQDALDTAHRNQISHDHQMEEIRRSNSQSRTDAETQDAKEMKIDEFVLNKTTTYSSPLNKSMDSDTKIKETGWKNMTATSVSSATHNAATKDSKSKLMGTGNGRKNKTTPNSFTHDGVLEQDSKNKGTEGGRIFYTKSSSASHRRGQNQDSKGTGAIRQNETTPSIPSERAIDALNPDSKIQETGKGNIYQTKSGLRTSNSVLSQDPKSKATGPRKKNDSTSGSPTNNSVLSQDPKSKATGPRIKNDSTPSSPTGSNVQDQKSVETGKGRTDASNTKPSQGIGLQSRDSTGNETNHSGINTAVLKKPPSKLDLNTSNTREETSKSQHSVNVQHKRVNGKKNGDGDVTQTERNVRASRLGYEKLEAGKATFNVKKYAVKKTWGKALEHCRSDGGTLVKIDNRLKNRSLTKKYAFFKSHWIGLKDLYDNNSFFWTDESPLTFSKWQTDQPSHTDTEGKEDCVDLSVDFLKGQGWNDQPCDKLYEFICEI